MKFFGTVLLFFLLIVSADSARAQFTQTLRYEREQSHSDNAWMVISMKEDGIALVRDREKFRDGLRLFEVVTLDSMLRETWTTELELKNRLQLIGYEYANQTIYLLFREGETDDGNLVQFSLALKTKEVVRAEIKHEFNFKLTHYSVVGPNTVLGGYVNREPAVLMYDPAAAQLKVIPGFFTSETELLDLRVNHNQTFNTLVTNHSIRSGKKLVLRTFDKDGVQLLEDAIEIDQEKKIIGGVTSTLKRDELLIAGTYTLGNAKQAAGIFSVTVDPFKEQVVNYYDFPELQHALDFMNPRRAYKITEAARRDRLRGRDPEYKIYASTVRLEEFNHGFLFLSELYTSSSNTGPYPYQSPYGSPYGPYYSYGMYPFTPYANRYYNSPYSYGNMPQNSDIHVLESLVAVFSSDGKLEWDHSLKLDNHRKPSLEQSSDFWSNKNKIAIATKKESEIWIKERFKNDEVRSDTLKIMLKNPTDVIRSETKEDEGIRFWYGNNFYVWGYQSLRDPSLSEDKNRSVFYIVKLNVN